MNARHLCRHFGPMNGQDCFAESPGRIPEQVAKTQQGRSSRFLPRKHLADRVRPAAPRSFCSAHPSGAPTLHDQGLSSDRVPGAGSQSAVRRSRTALSIHPVSDRFGDSVGNCPRLVHQVGPCSNMPNAILHIHPAARAASMFRGSGGNFPRRAPPADLCSHKLPLTQRIDLGRGHHQWSHHPVRSLPIGRMQAQQKQTAQSQQQTPAKTCS